ncbi:MAG: GtrA family protein [Spirochaetales bacterium]|nr:GtrA family protein [Spirochaetales bacterium]
MEEKPNIVFDLINKLWIKFEQFIKFNLVGLVNTAITFIIFALLNKFFQINKFVAEPVGYSCGLINSFIMNKLWTFGKKHRFHVLEGIKFVIVNGIALGGTLLILMVSEDYLHIDVLWGKLIGYCFSIPVNYLGFKFWVFKD